MQLSPQEKDKLLIFTAALVAERRKEKGLKLNYPDLLQYRQLLATLDPMEMPSVSATLEGN